MKKQVLLFAALAAATASFAQQKVTVNVKAGVNSASIVGNASKSLNSLVGYTNDIFQTHSKLGVFAGASVGIPVSEQFSIEPGINYDQKGYELRGSYQFDGIASVLSPTAKAQLNLDYISMPVLLKGNFGGFNVFAGPQVSYLANSKVRVTAGALGFNALDKSFDAGNQFNKWDMGIQAGLGYQLKNGLNISAAWDRGLTKVDANRNMDAYNQAFKVGVGFRF
ncbi:PorT family protein [Flaviaesturariibacter flavus]|uniref:PorT family protein n=1 Tax=Flaviaesturariibacter flavus TaxID=2502780 RepID=A0A4R1BAI3_9BACT|nr:porin family protein [Flaviaesturariibacter flavus]TCJ13971.1 PorT family protein [Flaviaesturariibacter flavus]